MPYPYWLVKPLPDITILKMSGQNLRGLHTVCESAACPNISECFHSKHLTFLILGNRCTRNCAFCAVDKGEPAPVDPQEGESLVAAVTRLSLEHVVITSVTRDDLKDGGAAHFAEVIKLLREKTTARIEVLIPDFGGNLQALEQVVKAGPDVMGHNVETVQRLQGKVRPQAAYMRSLTILRSIKEMNKDMLTKSGLILGLGENDTEILSTLEDIKEARCDIVTLGQYRQPGQRQMPVQRFILETGFNYLQNKALAMGFSVVLAGSYVRSSYRAAELKEMLEGRIIKNV